MVHKHAYVRTWIFTPVLGATTIGGSIFPFLLVSSTRLPPRGQGVVPGTGQPAGGLVCAQHLGGGHRRHLG